jgi:DNA-binding MarR family transcriptional regulator
MATKKKTARAHALIYAASLDDIVNYLVYRSARILRYKFQKDMQAAGLDMTQEQYFILFKLWQRDGQFQAELTNDVLSDAPNITRILDVMERKKMIERRADPHDRRKFLIFLAEEGKRIHQNYLEHVFQARLADYRSLGDKDLRELRRILRVIEKNIMVTTKEEQ